MTLHSVAFGIARTGDEPDNPAAQTTLGTGLLREFLLYAQQQLNRVPFALTHVEHDSARVKKSNARIHAMLQAQPAPVSCVMEPGCDQFQTHTALRLAADSRYQRLADMAGLPAPSFQGEGT